VIRYDSTSHIERPPDAVFARLADVESMGDWTEMAGSRWIGEPGPRLGARAEAVLRFGPFRRGLRWEVTAYEPNRRVAYQTLPGGSVDWTADYTLDQDATGTVIRQVGSVELHGMLRLIEPLIRLELPKGESRELDRLKAVLEGAPAAEMA
jgi:carbon monoxide dehydrogenase subunit G